MTTSSNASIGLRVHFIFSSEPAATSKEEIINPKDEPVNKPITNHKTLLLNILIPLENFVYLNY